MGEGERPRSRRKRPSPSFLPSFLPSPAGVEEKGEKGDPDFFPFRSSRGRRASPPLPSLACSGGGTTEEHGGGKAPSSFLHLRGSEKRRFFFLALPSRSSSANRQKPAGNKQRIEEEEEADPRKVVDKHCKNKRTDKEEGPTSSPPLLSSLFPGFSRLSHSWKRNLSNRLTLALSSTFSLRLARRRVRTENPKKITALSLAAAPRNLICGHSLFIFSLFSQNGGKRGCGCGRFKSRAVLNIAKHKKGQAAAGPSLLCFFAVRFPSCIHVGEVGLSAHFEAAAVCPYSLSS